MLNRFLLPIVALACAITGDAALAQPPVSERPTITVAKFDFGAASPTRNYSRTSRPYDRRGDFDEGAFVEAVGVGAADLVTEQLVASERFRVFERKSLDAIKQEQGLSAADGDTILRARYMVTGSVTHLGMNDKDAGGAIFSLASGILSHGAAMVHTSQSSTTVKLTARVVDTRTGEIIGSFTGQGQSDKRWGVNVAGFGRSGLGSVSSSDRNFRETAIGEATARAAAAIADQVVALRATTLRP